MNCKDLHNKIFRSVFYRISPEIATKVSKEIYLATNFSIKTAISEELDG